MSARGIKKRIHREFIPATDMPIPGGRLITVLGVPYVQLRTAEGGDLYLTRFGLQVHEWLAIENWYDEAWFAAHRVSLEGTSTVFRVTTREVRQRSLELVVKNCRVGEDVPGDTHTIEEALGAEFNSPWEEFALVMELREGAFGPRGYPVDTQRPLAIYVPPDTMQLWQSGRSRAKINRIKARHPAIDLDILRQYKLVYEWIEGTNIVELLREERVLGDALREESLRADREVTTHLAQKGYLVADMKPQHIIIRNPDRAFLYAETRLRRTVPERVRTLIHEHRYSIIDYELLARTPEHEERRRVSRRQSYLDALSHRDLAVAIPDNVHEMSILGVRYLETSVQSTGGSLWVVGRNPELIDFFLPERWRKTALWRLADDTELSYTITKDGVHLFWTTSRVGELLPAREDGRSVPYLSPFEVFSVLERLARAGVPVLAPRAIYQTHTSKLEPSLDTSAYERLRDYRREDGTEVLLEDRNYLMIFGFSQWMREGEVPKQVPPIPRPAGLSKAAARQMITDVEASRAVEAMRALVDQAGFDGSLIDRDDLLVTLDDDDQVVFSEPGVPRVRLCDAELVLPRAGRR